MKATVQIARVFGSMSRYGEEPRLSPPDTPLILDNWPFNGERAVIHLGTPHEPVFTAVKLSQAIGAACLQGFRNNPERFRDEVKELISREETRSFNWYITVLLEREIELHSDDLEDHEFIWLKPEKLTEIERGMKKYGTPHLDLLVSYIAKSLPGQFFEKKIINDRVFVLGEGKTSFGHFEAIFGSGSFEAFTTSPMDTLDLSKLKELLQVATNERRIVLSVLPTSQLISIVENATESDLKGKALEELIAQLFGTVSGFSIATRIRTETEEIDIRVMNDSNDRIFRREGAMIIAECKNWSSKCGKNEFVILREKIENRNGRCTIGFLISWNGFWETFTKEMLRGSRESVLIVPLTGAEIKKAVSSNNFLETICEAWEKVVNI